MYGAFVSVLLFILHLDTDPFQKIRSSAYSNFSVLGLAIVLIVGSLLIILGYTIESLVNTIETRLRHIHKYSRLEWSAHDILQTQRMAHDELGYGKWENCTGVRAVPVTTNNQSLAVLDVQDPKYPRLKPRVTAKVDEHVVEQDISSSTSVASNTESGTDTAAGINVRPQSGESDEQAGEGDMILEPATQYPSVDRTQSAVAGDDDPSYGGNLNRLSSRVESHAERQAGTAVTSNEEVSSSRTEN